MVGPVLGRPFAPGAVGRLLPAVLLERADEPRARRVDDEARRAVRPELEEPAHQFHALQDAGPRRPDADAPPGQFLARARAGHVAPLPAGRVAEGADHGAGVAVGHGAGVVGDGPFARHVLADDPHADAGKVHVGAVPRRPLAGVRGQRVVHSALRTPHSALVFHLHP